MKIEDIKDGDMLWIFDRAKDKYVKREVKVTPGRNLFYLSDPRGYFKVRDTVYVDQRDDIVTDDELPAAKKRHAARRKAEKEAEAQREARVNRAHDVAEQMFAVGMGRRTYGDGVEKASINHDGLLTVSITPEQAEMLLAFMRTERAPE